MMLGYVYKKENRTEDAERCFLTAANHAAVRGDGEALKEAEEELKALGIRLSIAPAKKL